MPFVVIAFFRFPFTANNLPIVAAVILVAFIYLMVRPNKYVNDNEVKIDVSKIK